MAGNQEKTRQHVAIGNNLVIKSRKGHTCCHYEGYLFIFGGMQGLTNEKNEMLVFDLKNESWQEATTNTNELIKMYQRSLKT